MKNSENFNEKLFEKIFDLNSRNKIGSNTITVFTFILYKCEDVQKEIELSDYEMARELGLSRQTVITAKNKLKLLGLLDYRRNPGFSNRFILKANELPKEKPTIIIETKEIPVDGLNRITEPKAVAINSFSKFPTLEQFMDFAKTLNNYSEKLDELLAKKFHQWENSDWKNPLGKPILNWQSVLEKNIIMLEISLSKESHSLPKIPNISRPKVD